MNSTNMSLPIPTVGVTLGPEYAFDVNAALTLIDQHDHSPGKGVPITPAGLSIDDDLSFGHNSLTDAKSLVFTPQSAVLNTLTSVYVVAEDLWYTDSLGNHIQITDAGAVNATVGNIAGQSYAAGTFIWKQGTGSTTPADFDIGSIILRPNTAATTYGLTLSPPAGIASSYTINLPALPASTLPLQISSSGALTAAQIPAAGLATDSVTTAKILAANVTNVKLATDAVSTAKIVDGAVTIAKSTPNYAIATLSNTNITSANTTITGASITTVGGHPVIISLIDGFVGYVEGGGGSGTLQFILYRDGAALYTFTRVTSNGSSGTYYSRSFGIGPDSTSTGVIEQAGAFTYVDDLPPAGLHSYDIRVTLSGSFGSGGKGQVTSVKMFVQET